jgi:ferritin-like metal-binding protein YciE
VEELAALLDAENQLTDALPRLARAVTSKPLRKAFDAYPKQTLAHVLD